MIENQFLSIDQNSYMAPNTSGYSQNQTVYYQESTKPFYYGSNHGYSLPKLESQVTDHVPDNPLTAQPCQIEDKVIKKNKKAKDINFNGK